MSALSIGVRNVAVGNSSLASATGIQDTVCIGSFAGSAMTAGSFNTILGQRAAGFTGGLDDGNVVIGYECLKNGGLNTHKSVFVGGQSGINASCPNTVAVGYETLQSATAEAIGIGYQALQSLTSSPGNLGIGTAALGGVQTDATGSNTAVGMNCLASCTTSNNTGLGWTAGAQITTGTDNTVIGRNAGLNVVTGSSNVIIGSAADAGAAVSNSIVIGSSISTATSNQILIGNGSTTSCIINGINGQSSTGGTPVYVNGSGVLGSSNLMMFEVEETKVTQVPKNLFDSLRPVCVSEPDGPRMKLISSEGVSEQDLIPILVAEIQRLGKLVEQNCVNFHS